MDTTPRGILTLTPVISKCIRTSRYIAIGPVPDKPYSQTLSSDKPDLLIVLLDRLTKHVD